MPSKQNSSSKEKLLIGRKEDVNLPDLKLKAIDAKIDTGAYSSSIHCHHIKLAKRDGRQVLKFKLLDPEHENYQKRVFVFKNFKTTKVKSSNGKSENRFVIKTNVEIFDKKFKTEFTLTDRSDMKYPILLGRKFIKQGFIVDVNKYDLATKGKKYTIQAIKGTK
jgi:hypothetical protein